MSGCIREIYLENINRILKIHQQEVGDVGCVVWDAAIVLAKYLETISHKLNVKGLKVIELGAGLGCAGLTAACLGADVTMTDLPEIIPLLEYNILVNKDSWVSSSGRAVAKPLKWCTDFKIGDWFQPDILLMADCIYYLESIDELLTTICKLCGESTELIMCQEERDTEKQKIVWNKFFKSFEKIFNYYKVPEKEQHPLFRSFDIFIIRAKKKHSFSLLGFENNNS